MNCFVATSYPIIFYALKNFHLDDIFIISLNNNIAKFCKDTAIKFCYIEKPVNYSFKKLFAYKNELVNISKKFNNEIIFFNFYTNDVFGLFLIKELKKKNKVCFVMSHQDHVPNIIIEKIKYINLLKKKNFKRIFFNYIVYLIVLKIPFDIFEVYDDHYVIGINTKKLKRSFPLHLFKKNETIFNTNKQKIQVTLAIPAIDILYIDDGESEVLYNPKLINSLFTGLISLGYTIAIKHHPGYENNKISFPKSYELPIYYPVELLVHYVKKAIVCVSSTSYYNITESIIKISLAELVCWHKPEDKKLIIYLMNKVKEINFPVNKEEFIKLIEK